tara:strand:- start:78 stop:686 length:609 start_codon:yes stop_codon:yes gene_type:complete
MIYLSGRFKSTLPKEVGLLVTPGNRGKARQGRIWAADNGRFAAPDKYSDASYLKWLMAQDKKSDCLFATAPDVVGDHHATLQLSAHMYSPIRQAGYPVAFVAQNGFDDAPWSSFDALFIGGDDAFKLGPQVPGIVREAKRRGKWVHMGRVNSYLRLRLATVIGCDSVDGNHIAFMPDKHTADVAQWIKQLAAQPILDLTGEM